MNKERYKELMNNETLKLTKKEVESGWRFCNSWDCLLIHQSWPEADLCDCGCMDGLKDE